MRRLVCIAFLAVLSLPAQQFPDADALLRHSTEVLTSFQSLEFTTSTYMDSEVPILTALVRIKQGKRHMESSSPSTGTTIWITDGQNMWVYFPLGKSYSKFPDRQPFGGWAPGAGSVPSGAKVVRSEVIQIDGQWHDCWVAEGHIAPDKYHNVDVTSDSWFEKDSGLLLQTSTKSQSPTSATERKSTNYRFTFNLFLDDSLFVFTPPPDTKKVPFPELGGTAPEPK